MKQIHRPILVIVLVAQTQGNSQMGILTMTISQNSKIPPKPLVNSINKPHLPYTSHPLHFKGSLALPLSFSLKT